MIDSTATHSLVAPFLAPGNSRKRFKGQGDHTRLDLIFEEENDFLTSGHFQSFRHSRSPVQLAPSASLLDLLPQELLEKIMDSCDAKELAALEATCKLFDRSKMVQHYAQHRLQRSQRVQRCLQPGAGENWITLLRFAELQTIAQAQSTALALGAHHTAALLASPTHKSGYVLSTFGRGLQGQLGDGSYRQACWTPKCIVGVDNTSSLEPMICQEEDFESMIPDPEIGKRLKEILERLVRSAYPAVVNAGADYTLMIACSGTPYSWGMSRRGALGQELYITSNASPQQLIKTFRERIVSVNAGTAHSLVLTEAGEIYACGCNEHGQLGVPGTEDQSLLTRVAIGDNGYIGPVSSVAAGHSHSVALTDAGQVWTWGLGSSGQLGNAAIAATIAQRPGLPVGTNQPSPVLSLDPGVLDMQDRVTCVSAGGDQTALVTVNGKLIVFGANKHGCIGAGHLDPVLLPKEASFAHLSGHEAGPFRVLQALCGRHHILVLALFCGKTIVCTAGYNFFGQLGLGDFVSRQTFTVVSALSDLVIVSVAAGFDHSAAVSADKRIFMWGRNDSGQLGIGSDDHTPVPTEVQDCRLAAAQKTLGREL